MLLRLGCALILGLTGMAGTATGQDDLMIDWAVLDRFAASRAVPTILELTPVPTERREAITSVTSKAHMARMEEGGAKPLAQEALSLTQIPTSVESATATVTAHDSDAHDSDAGSAAPSQSASLPQEVAAPSQIPSQALASQTVASAPPAAALPFIRIPYSGTETKVPSAAAAQLARLVQRLQDHPQEYAILMGYSNAGSASEGRKLALQRLRTLRKTLLASRLASRRFVLKPRGQAEDAPSERVDIVIRSR